MNYYAGNDYRNYLAHYGVLGMRWGVRRYQPYSYTGARKSGKAGKEIGEAKAKVKKEKTRRDSGWGPAAELAVNIALDVIALRPVGAVMDAYRLGEFASAQMKTKSVLKKISKSPIDKKTGLRLKPKAMTEKQDMAMVNPGFKNLNENTKKNCMLCTTVYDLRRRGYDVTANTALWGYNSTDLKKWYPKAKIEHPVPNPTTPEEWRTKRMSAMSLGGNKECADKTMTALRSQPEGSRGNLMVQWGAGGGHSMVYEVKNGEVVVRDCQSNKVYTKPEKILKKCVSSEFARLDNVKFNLEEIKEAVR